ncbi:putative Voltage and ligand gated potassium channel [Operophtera brumata]|uniref:Putative Voltage and ligand gated potassium channel n=1 Tax=Operophtera brumata TaxID=104452 RepID=A0A0L7KMR2_OPEBR|nr:putative Voltage and ligand gated potassium channel [Operophtera brumata]
MSLKHSDVTHVFPQDIEEEEASDDAQIEWSDLIFLPFHSVFKLLVLFSVIVKSILIKETNEEYTTYIYSTLFVFSFAVGNIIDETKPSTIIEFIVVSGLEILGNLLTIFVVIPKIFGEVIIRLRRIFSYYPQVRRLVAETKRRHTSRNAYIELENIFNMIWIKRSGITRLPEIITEMPRCLRLDLKQDLVWPVFHHSPILRNSSTPLKRMICDLIVPDYKLPGEKLYSGINSHSHLYYLKSGIVQILSADDGTTPIISVTSGTIFGDISFQVPPLKCKNMIRCLTYCEVLYLTRIDYIRSLYHHPDDRRKILDMVKDRMKHARTLYNCKQHVRGLDRTEDEGIAWVKRRWWEVSDAINSWKNRSSKSDDQRHELPPEEAIYHCAKYIGQLVLCTDIQLQTKSLFANARFPWILLPHSSFGIIWHRVVTGTVFMVLILYPPIVTSLRPTPSWFRFFECWTDIIYAADICVSLFTAIAERDNLTTSFAAVMFARCKSLYFILDVMATIWTEYIVVIIGKSELSNIVRLNRLIKIYMLFTGDTVVWDVKKNPMMIVCYKIILLVFSFMYLLGYLMYVISRFTPDMTKNYFFGEYSCEPITPTDQCDPGRIFFMGTAIAWVMELMFPEFLPLTLVDVYYGIVLEYAIFLIFIFCKVQFIAAMYLKHMDVLNFQYFVFNLKKYYHYYKIHQHLLKRLDSYLVCQWKYFKGTDIMHPNMLKTEPYGVYLKVQGEVAEKIIGESIAFIGADPLLIRELAYASQLLILPKNAVLFLFNVQCKNVSWIVQVS